MGSTGGFITIHRKILGWEWYKNTNTFALFLHLLLTANFVDGRFEGKTIQRGQLVTSVASLSAQTGLTVKQVRVALEHLTKTGEVASKPYPRYRVITITNYDAYQSEGKQEGNQEGNREGSQRASEGQAKGKLEGSQTASKGQQYNNNNKDNNDNKGTRITKESLSLFDVFWSAYPRHVAKQAALSAWQKLKPDGELLDRIMEGLARWKASDDWQRDDGRYIPHPATWLNGKRWEDEMRQRPTATAAKAVSAQRYSQRDYAEVQDDLLARQRSEFEMLLERERREGRL